MPQLRPAGGAAATAAFDGSAELNFNYRVLSIARAHVDRNVTRDEEITFSFSSRFDPAGGGIRRKFFWKDPLWSNYATINYANDA